MNLLQQLQDFHPYNAQEAQDKELILEHLKVQNSFTRENTTAHFTASAWVVNHARDKILMVYHNLYDSWSWLGGHADGDKDLQAVALKEVKEESGLTHVRLVSDEIFSIEVLTVDGHVRRGEYVSSHLHLNVTYLIEADESHALTIQPSENSDVKWFALDDAVAASSEPWFRENVYKKLNEKLLKR